MTAFVLHDAISGPMLGYVAASGMLTLMMVRVLGLVREVAQISERAERAHSDWSRAKND